MSGDLLSVPGLRGAAVATGVKQSGKLDLALIAADGPRTAAGVFTRNALPAAPVRVCRELLARSRRVHGVVINSGNANAMTGAQGLRDAWQMAEHAAQACGGPALVLSTGVIGVPLPAQAVLNGIDRAGAELSTRAGELVAQAMLTTDTGPKTSEHRLELGGRTYVFAGIAKGSGMIHPNMATMLAVWATDLELTPAALDHVLRAAVERSFHEISVDGDTSTNDAVIALAGGAGGAPLDVGDPALERVTAVATAVCRELAEAIVLDGEGRTRVLEILVTGAASEAAASACAPSSWWATAPALGACSPPTSPIAMSRSTPSIGRSGSGAVNKADAVESARNVIEPRSPPSPGDPMRSLALLLLLLWQPLAHAQDQAEAHRLAVSMDTLAAKNAWEGVERAFVAIEALGTAIPRPTLVLGAEAARTRGDVSAQRTRLLAAQALEPSPEAAATLADLDQSFGAVDLTCRGECPAIVAIVDPFRADHKAAIAFANTAITEAQRFQGELPVGTYGFGHSSVQVVAGAPAVPVVATSKAARVRGLLQEIQLPRTATVGKRGLLALNGAGLWSVDDQLFCVGALYLSQPTTLAEQAIADTHAKRILLHWLVPQTGAQVGEHFAKRFALNDPQETSWADQQLFLMLIDKVNVGDRLIFDWLPKEKAVRVWVNDNDQGLIKSDAFMRVLWASLVGEHALSDDIRRGMLGDGLAMPAEVAVP